MSIARVLLCVWAISNVARAEEGALRWRFQPGEVQNYRMTQTARLELHLPGDSNVVTEVRRVFDFRWSVQSVDPNGTGTIAVEVTAVKLHVSGPGGQQTEYDSTREDESRGFAATLGPLFQTMLKSELVARVSSRGELLQLEVPEDLQTMLHSKPAGKALGQLGSAADLESLVRLGLPELPDGDLAVGDEWQEDRSVECGTLGSLVAHTTYLWESTREENGEQVAVIVPSTTFRFAEAQEGAPEVTSNEQLSSGEIQFHFTAGRLESSERHDGLTLTIHEGEEPTTGILEHVLSFELVPKPE
jgi:hypothetical protein